MHQAQVALITNNPNTSRQASVPASRRLSCEREMSGESKILFQPGSYPNCEAGNNPQIYENIETYISGRPTGNCNCKVKFYVMKARNAFHISRN